MTHPLIIQFIKDYRTKHPGVGKEAIKPELDKYCDRKNIPSLSTSTIGRIIKDLKERGEIPLSSKKLSLNARTGRLYLREKKIRES